jgi:quinoprotein glucose dehydrogenase
VNIDGGTAADPETGMVYVGSQSGMSVISVEHDPCSEIPYTSPHNSCGKLGALPEPAGYTPPTGGVSTGAFSRVSVPNSIGGVSIFKPKELGGITAYDLHTGDKIWWQPNGGIWRDPAPTNDPLFATVTLPKIPNNTSQPQIITTKTLLINGTGRQGGGGGRGGRGTGGGRGPAGPPPQLYAFNKATGKEVGAVKIGPQPTSAVPMTFMHKGKQYIVFATGAGKDIHLVALTLP